MPKKKKQNSIRMFERKKQKRKQSVSKSTDVIQTGGFHALYVFTHR